MRVVVWQFAAALCLPGICTAAGWASLSGTVKDERGDGAYLAQVVVSSKQYPAGQNAVVDKSGFFKIEGLKPGSYDVRIEQQGFQPVRKRIKVTAGSKSVKLNAVLKIAAKSEQIAIDSQGTSPQREAPSTHKSKNYLANQQQ